MSVYDVSLWVFWCHMLVSKWQFCWTAFKWVQFSWTAFLWIPINGFVINKTWNWCSSLVVNWVDQWTPSAWRPTPFFSVSRHRTYIYSKNDSVDPCLPFINLSTLWPIYCLHWESIISIKDGSPVLILLEEEVATCCNGKGSFRKVTLQLAIRQYYSHTVQTHYVISPLMVLASKYITVTTGPFLEPDVWKTWGATRNIMASSRLQANQFSLGTLSCQLAWSFTKAIH